MTPVDSSRPRAEKEAEELRERRSVDTREVIDAVRRVTRGLRLAAGATQATMGLSVAQHYVLRCLADADGVSINELAKMTYTDRSSVASVVERLADRGLVKRSAAASDRRRADIRLTRSGRDMLDKASAAPGAMLVTALERLNEDELSVLAHSLNQLVGALGLGGTPIRMLFDEVQDQ